jgi:uncharacterized protein YdhG (YjbR/CyaY superfamily)
MPSYRVAGRRIAYFSLHGRHIGLYPAGREDAISCGLERFWASRSTLRFPVDTPLPEASIRRPIEQRVARAQNLEDT